MPVDVQFSNSPALASNAPLWRLAKPCAAMNSRSCLGMHTSGKRVMAKIKALVYSIGIQNG